MNKKRITIIGCGKMGYALLSIMEAGGQYDVRGVEKDYSRKSELAGSTIYDSISEAGPSDIYVIAVKPQDIDKVLSELSAIIKGVSSPVWIISIAAGIRSAYIKRSLPESSARIVRLMPNTPLLFGEGLTGVVISEEDRDAGKDDIRLIDSIIDALGEKVHVNEELMDAVTALSGSGPAYFFYIAEVMERFARDSGIEGTEDIRRLIYQTVRGSGQMMKMSGKPFKELKEDVTSPGGTTEAALNYLSENSFDEIFYNALRKACERSRELSGEKLSGEKLSGKKLFGKGEEEK
ncbi:MAG: pyrroline-5-carboxylate reductase [Elusimicrobiota bacterium]